MKKRTAVNGFLNENGVTINLNSAKALNSVVGHEITHVLEGTELYDTLAQSITEYAKSKGEYDSRLKALTELYKGREGYTGENADAKIQQEVVADLVGDYLFTDSDFIGRLSAENRGLFQKIFDEVKYLCKVAKAGSKEARQLEKVKKAFEDAYRTERKNPTGDGGVKYSLNQFEDGKRFVDVQMDAHIFDGMTVAEMNRTAKSILMEKFAGRVIGVDNQAFVNGDSVNEYLHPSKAIESDIRRAKLTAAGELDNLLDAGEALPNEPDGKDGHIHPDAIDFSYFKTIFKVGNEYFEGIINIKNIKRGKLFKDVTKIRNITKDIVSSYGKNPKSNFLRDASMNSIRNSGKDVNTKNSLSSADEVTQPVRGGVYGKDVLLEGLDAISENKNAGQDIADSELVAGLETIAKGSEVESQYAEPFPSEENLMETELREMDDAYRVQAEGEGYASSLYDSGEGGVDTVARRLEVKRQNAQWELEASQKSRQEAMAVYDEKIASMQAKYDAKPNKHTKAAESQWAGGTTFFLFNWICDTAICRP